MKYLVLIFCLISNIVYANPGRFGGFTYNLDNKGRVKYDEKTTELTTNFNNDFAKGLGEAPKKPYYLTDNNKKTIIKDKYKLVPTYSLKEIHNSKHTEKGKIDNDQTDDIENSNENETSNNKDDTDPE